MHKMLFHFVDHKVLSQQKKQKTIELYIAQRNNTPLKFILCETHSMKWTSFLGHGLNGRRIIFIKFFKMMEVKWTGIRIELYD